MAATALDTVYLEHWMPGRARLRVPRPRTVAHVRRLAGRVGSTGRVRGVDVNAQTGSLLVRFDDDDPIDLIIDELRLAGLQVLSTMEREGTGIRTQSAGAATVRHVMGRANALLHVKTRGKFDLKLAVPAIYLLFATRAFLRQRGTIKDATWYQLLYWAFDSFFKLHEETTTTQRGGASRGRTAD